MLSKALAKKIKLREGPVVEELDMANLYSHDEEYTRAFLAITSKYEAEFPFEDGWLKKFIYKRAKGKECAKVIIYPITEEEMIKLEED